MYDRLAQQLSADTVVSLLSLACQRKQHWNLPRNLKATKYNIVEFYDEEGNKEMLGASPSGTVTNADPEAVEEWRSTMWELPERLNRHKSSWEQLKAGEKNDRERERETERKN